MSADQIMLRDKIRELVECQIGRTNEVTGAATRNVEVVFLNLLKAFPDMTAEELAVACAEIMTRLQSGIAMLAELSKRAKGDKTLLRNSLRKLGD
jgi:hypothetical protein